MTSRCVRFRVGSVDDFQDVTYQALLESVLRLHTGLGFRGLGV